MILRHLSETLRATDALIRHVERRSGGRELALAKTKLEEAEMWLERAKRELPEGLKQWIEPDPNWKPPRPTA